ncbi:MAG: alpha/beta fold hydrolase [Candidatus Mycalebacterium zealandia]|nr:MAG: alpha/beta fold hydrolase [Candidatus Mycalebacterium zealandia]
MHRCYASRSGAERGVLGKQIEALSGYTRFPALALDMPGHGGSSGEAMTSMEDCADFVSGFCLQAGILNPILIGHSMGGRIAQIIALGGEVKPLACMLVATGVRIRVSRWSLKTVRNNYENFCVTAAQNAFASGANGRTRDVFLRRLLAQAPQSVYNDLLACDNFDISDLVGRIDVPTVIVAGSDDVLTPAKHTNFLHSKIKGSKLFVIEGAGHFMMMEKPDEFNKTVFDFLNLL